MGLDLSDRLLRSVRKPARYVNREHNSVHKRHADVDVTFALAFPDVYEVGMSHLGTQILYHVLNAREDVACERVYAPWIDMEERMRATGLPLFALESRRPVREFDLVGFSLQHEMGYTNVLNMLDLAGVPPRASERGAEDPLVLAGGPCAFNPEPIVPFIDLFVLGDGEEVVHDIVDLYRGLKRGGERPDRSEFLSEAAGIEGVYVPSLYDVEYGANGNVSEIRPRGNAPEVVRRRLVRDLDAVDYPERPVVPFLETVHDRACLELFRGCTRGCRFCLAGFVHRPVRERSPREVERISDSLVDSTGYDEISLMSLSSADYSAIDDVARSLVERHGPRGIGISLPSLRTDTLSIDLARQVQSVRRTGLTLAPEAGSQRLRDVINKQVTDDDLMEAARAAFDAGWRRLKLYFMVGLPTETDEDLDSIADLVERVHALFRHSRREGRYAGRPLLIHVSLAAFVPKPHTPFQWEAQPGLEELERRHRRVRQEMPGGRKRRVSVDWHDPRLSHLEAVFSRGDRRLAPVLERAWRLGARFDDWGELFDYDLWTEAFRLEGIDPSFYANRERERDETLPWSHLDTGVSDDFLWEEHLRAYRGESTPDCRGNGCANCGVCARYDVRPILHDEQGGGAPAEDQGQVHQGG